MKNSLFARVFAGYLLIILAFAAVSLFAFTDIFRELYYRSFTDNLANLGLFLRADVAASLEQGDYARLDALAGKVREGTGARLTVIDPEGKVAADSHENRLVMENHRNRPEIVQALAGRKTVSRRYSSTLNRDVLYVALPLLKDGAVIAVIRTSFSPGDIRIPRLVMARMVGMWALFSLVALAAALLVSRSVSHPIRDLTSAARRLASGDFNTRVFLKRNDELRSLADTFNSMSRELESAFEELKRQRAELKSIIDSLREGLVVVDKRGSIIYCNESLKALLGNGAPLEGRLYWEALRQSQFVELMEKARSGKLSAVEEVEIEGKVMLCSASHITPDDEAVLVLHDITGMRELERIKRDLVSSVSHELRTPLTSIKGFAETLEEEVGEENRHYVEIIRRNADRLINIVRDLLLLSELEEKDSAFLEIEEVDLHALAVNTLRLFEHQAGQKGLALSLDCPAGLPSVQADPFKIEQVLVNLLDNAIKYTDTGEVVLTIQVGREAMIEVRDTGIGMPKEKLSRIFERFYVVDKSRSRKTGGTGLGLSIVKHIVLLHGGQISVESTPGTGSRFLVRLPLVQSV
jgi:two-component system phosphate regulon sensor histidine kinase PhoR